MSNNKDVINNREKKPDKKNISKRLKYNSYSSVVIVVLIAIAVVLNMVVSMSVDKFGLKADLTPTNVFEISDKTKELLKTVDKKINIYSLTNSGFSYTGYLDDELANIMNNIDVYIGNYQAQNSNISFQEVYVNSNPAFAEKYTSKGENISIGSLIVECGDKYKMIDTNTYFKRGSESGDTYMQLEQLLTSAIAYVISDRTYDIAFTTGHNENTDAVEALKSVYGIENYNCRDIDLASGEISENICTIVISNPSMDFTDEELAKLDEYFKGGNNLMLFMDVTDVTLPNLYSYLSEWGIAVNNDMVVEGDTTKFSKNTPNVIIGTPSGESSITAPIKNSNVYFPYARSITVTSVPSVTTEVLYQTSDSAYAKTNLHSGKPEKEEDDKSGQFTLCTLSNRQLYVEKNTVNAKLFVCASTDAAVLAAQEGANKQFVINAANSINNRSESVTIEAKQINKTPTFELAQSQSDLIKGIVIYIIPLIIIFIGLIVWLKRKQA